MKTYSEGWTVFLARRIVLPFLGVSSPDCNQNRTDLVTVGRQRVRVVAGSEGATDKSTPDCPYCLYFTVLQRFCVIIRYNQPVMPEDALCSTPLRLSKPPKTNMHRIKTPGIGAKKPYRTYLGPFSQTHFAVGRMVSLFKGAVYKICISI